MTAARSLPDRPSLESLRKQAKKLARDIAAMSQRASCIIWSSSRSVTEKACRSGPMGLYRPGFRRDLKGDMAPGRYIPSTLRLLASRDAWSARKADSGTGRTPAPGHDGALHALEFGGARCGSPVWRPAPRRATWPRRNSGGVGNGGPEGPYSLTKVGGGGGS